MFTIKFYSEDNYRQVIEEADSFTVLRGPKDAVVEITEITLHRRTGEDKRIDIGKAPHQGENWPPVFYRAIIENSAGKTSEIIAAGLYNVG